MDTIKILKESCSGFPMIWDVVLPDGSDGYIKYRWGIISLKPITKKAGIFQEAIIEEQIGHEYDGELTLESAVEWLHSKGYKCEVSV